MNNLTVEIQYTLADGKRICIDVTIEVKEQLEKFDRQIRSQQRQDRRHLDFAEFVDDRTSAKAMYAQKDVADLLLKFERRDFIYQALMRLTEKQRRRLTLRFVYHMSYRKIARYESANPKTISESVNRALDKLRYDLQKNL
jgi:DNA-directed RNA polymerase specialized sigma24 family protein